MADPIKNPLLIDAFYEDDGSSLWWDMGIKGGPVVRFEADATAFVEIICQYNDLAIQLKVAREKALGAVHNSGLKSYGENCAALISPPGVQLAIQIDGAGTEQTFFLSSDRARALAQMLIEKADRTDQLKDEKRH